MFKAKKVLKSPNFDDYESLVCNFFLETKINSIDTALHVFEIIDRNHMHNNSGAIKFYKSFSNNINYRTFYLF